MIIEVTKKGEFVPEWNKNRDLSAGDQIRVTWDRLSKSERKRFTKTSDPEIIIHDFGSKSVKEVDQELDQQSDLKMIISNNDDGKLNAMNIKISNLETNEGPIDTWGKLNDVPGTYFDDLINEISKNLLNKELPLDEGTVKN